MTASERNTLFEQKEYMIRQTINKHYPLLRACRMNREDMYQDLAIRLLEALEKYDARLCSNMDAYLMLQLRYKLWNLTTCSKRFGMPLAPRKGFSVLSLQALDRYGNEREVPDSDDRADPMWIEREISALPDDQRYVLNRVLSGKRVPHNNKSLIAARSRFRVKADSRLAAMAV